MKRIIVALLALAMLCGCAFADEAVLEVTGFGRVYMEANQASATLGYSVSGEDLAQLQQKCNATVAAICEALQQAGLDEKNISTNYIYVSPRYDYSTETEQLIGYSISNSLAIVTDKIDMIGTYIDAAFAAGANNFDSISFSAKDGTLARKNALKLAVEDAMEKAQVIAAASGKTLGDVVEIKECPDSYSYNAVNAAAKSATMEFADAAMGTTVRASQVEVSANIQITYELK